MDLGHFKTPEVTPMLVKLYDKHKSYSQAHHEKPSMRVELTSVVSDLLVMDLTPREQELIADILISLMRQAERDLREALSERLSVLQNVPLRLILEMANDDIVVASPILKKSNILGDMDLIYIIKSKTAEYWRAIAERKTMSEQLINMLADTKDLGTAIQLAENQNITLTPHAMSVLSDVAQGQERLATPLVRRSEVTPDIVQSLYRFVGDALKQHLKEKYNIQDNKVEETLDDIIIDFVEHEEAGFKPTSKMLLAAAHLHRKKLVDPELMIGTLKRSQYRLFVSLFSVYAGIDSDRMLEILSEPSGRNLAVICRVKNVMRADFLSLFLLSVALHNKGNPLNSKDIEKAGEYYDRITPDMAKEFFKNSLSAH